MLLTIGVAAAPLAPYPLGWKKGGSNPLIGTSTRCADVITAGPPGASSRLSSVSAAHFCASGPGTDVDARGAAVVIPLDVVDTAKLSIASEAPPKQRSKATQTRRSKTPDWEAGFFFIGFLRCIPIGD